MNPVRSGDSGKRLTSTNYRFLLAPNSCFGDLFNFIEDENKRLGYSYAHETEIYGHSQETPDNDNILLSETKLRPLINYDHQPSIVKSSTRVFKYYLLNFPVSTNTVNNISVN